jgi:hypothetical protein
MATAGGLIIGAVGLGTLYSTCIECYCVFHTIRAFDRDSEYLVSKLETEGALLMRWGERIGLLSGHKRDIDPQLHDPWTKKAVAGVLHCIEILLTDTDKLQTTYGLIPHDRSVRIIGPRASSSKQGCCPSQTQVQPSERIRPEGKRANILRKFHWSILEKEKFNDLINDLRDLVQRLNELAPPKSDVSDCRVVSKSVPGLPRPNGSSERGDSNELEHREGTSRILDTPRKQVKQLAILPTPYRSPGQAMLTRPVGYIEEIPRPQSIQVRRDDEDDSGKIYRYYRVT